MGDPCAKEPLFSALGDLDGSVRLAAAEALAILGEPKWNEIIKGDYEDFARLGKSKDPRFIAPFIRALCKNDGHERLIVAKALANLGESQWFDIIKGNKKDIVRMGQTNDIRVIEVLTYLLDYEDEWADRKNAALSILKIAKANPEINVIDIKLYNELQDMHEDYKYGSSSDCNEQSHEDNSLGIDIDKYTRKE